MWARSLRRFTKIEAVLAHVNASAAECHAFHLQPETLFECRIERGPDKPARSDDSVPGERIAALAQDLRNLPVMERVAGLFRDLTVSRHFAVGDRRDGPANGRFRCTRFARDCS